MNPAPSIAQHYSPENLTERVRQALLERGLGEGTLSPEKLAPLDQFHTRGLEATIELAALCEIRPETRVLDIGSGLGGPSRYLAQVFDCHVEGVDLSPAYVEVATYLAERAGLDPRLTYRQGNALALPFPDQTFDLAWTQHVAMNISDRATLYREVHRVLKTGGRLAIFDVVQKSAEEIYFPVPWAKTPAESFLKNPAQMREVLTDAGFAVKSWEDRSAEGIAWFQEMDRKMAAAPPGLPPLNLQLALGAGAPAMVANLRRNLTEGRVGLIQTVLSRD